MGETETQDRNSSVALKRLRAMLESVAPGAERQLPPERDLAVEIGVGRRALRRALEVLEAEGRIWRRQGSGTFTGSRPWAPTSAVRELLTKITATEVMQARRQLEPGLAALAARNADEAALAILKRLAACTAGAADADARELWDGALHRAIAEAAGNALLLALFDIVDRVRQEPRWRALRERARNTDRQALYGAQHRAIVDAIAGRRPAEAEAAMRAHLEALEASLRDVEALADAG